MPKNITFAYIWCLITVGCIAFAANAHAQFGQSDGLAREHNYHVIHSDIYLSFDEAKGEVIGRVTHKIAPLRENTDSISFDAVEMEIKDVAVHQSEGGNGGSDVQKFDTANNSLNVYFTNKVSPRDTLDVTITYTCTPRKGLYFISPDPANPTKPKQIWSQGEGEDNRYWIPCYDYPNDKATIDMYATVPENYSALSNGALIKTIQNSDGTKTWHWAEKHPISSYLITLATGEFDVVKDPKGFRGRPVDYWAWKGRGGDLDSAFSYTPDMMEYFSHLIDYPYAWEKYSQVIVADFIYGGMENASATTLVDMALHDKRAQLDYNAMGLIAHELAHQWFGDVVTCRDWRQMWLNEGFATYFQMLYFEHLYGEDRFRYDIWNTQRGSVEAESAGGRKAIVMTNGLTANTYGKAATVLNLIRHVLGDDDFFRALHHYITVHQFNNVETEDLRIAIEETTGRNLTAIFDEWLYKPGHPIFDVTCAWDPAKKIMMTVAQTQKHDSISGYFAVPMDIEIALPNKKIIKTIEIKADSVNTFTFDCPEKPEYIVFDKGSNVPKELHFHRSLDEILAQLQYGDPVERGYAVVDLKEYDSLPTALHALEKAAQSDSFTQVRQEAISILGDVKSNEAQAAIIQLCKSADPQIRLTAVNQLGEFPTENAYAAAMGILRNEDSYGVKRAAISAIGTMDTALHKQSFDLIASYADSNSYRDWLRGSALNAMRTLKDPRAIPYAMKYARGGCVRDARVDAIRVLEKLAVGNHDAEELLMQCLSDKSHAVRNSAASALGIIGDESLVPELKEKLEKENYDWVKETIQKTIDKLEKGKKG